MTFERKYTDEVRERSVEDVLRRRREEPGNRAIIREVAEAHDVGQQSLRQWLARYDDGSYDYDEDGAAPAASAARYRRMPRAELIARLAELEQQVQELGEDNRSLRRVVALFSRDERA